MYWWTLRRLLQVPTALHCSLPLDSAYLLPYGVFQSFGFAEAVLSYWLMYTGRDDVDAPGCGEDVEGPEASAVARLLDLAQPPAAQ